MRWTSRTGIFFSVGIAANADDEYQQVLNAGTAAEGNGGLVEYAKIRRNKKWFHLKQVRTDGQSWLEIKLEDLGAGDGDRVDRISLQFSHHAADESTARIQVDDVFVQEFVPM